MTILSSRSLILWISVFSITSPSADFGRLRKTSDFFGRLRTYSRIFGNDRVVFKNPRTPRIKILRLYLRKSWQVYECIHNSTIDNEALTMCSIRKFKRERLNLLTDSKGKRWVLLLLVLSSPWAVRAMAWDQSLQSCFLSITIFR